MRLCPLGVGDQGQSWSGRPVGRGADIGNGLRQVTGYGSWDPDERLCDPESNCRPKPTSSEVAPVMTNPGQQRAFVRRVLEEDGQRSPMLVARASRS